jgi:rubrerythrin
MFTRGEIIDLAVRIEHNGETFYRRFADCALTPEVRRLAGWLADQEVTHARFFRELKERMPVESLRAPQSTTATGALEDFMGSHGFSLDEVECRALTDVRTLLEVAIEFERDTMLFFDMIKGFVDDLGALQELEQIIAEERHHVALLERQLREGAAEVVAAGMPMSQVVAS